MADEKISKARLDSYVIALAQGIVMRQAGRNPLALAREAVPMALALIAEVDAATK